jgi:transcription-repair coupling factor (superfamily II helicase)
MWTRASDLNQIDQLEAEFKDRFGFPPPEVKNLLYAVKLKALAAKAAVESISTEDGQIVIRRFQGMPFDQQRVKYYIRDGIKSGVTHIYLNPKRIRDWQKVLEEVVKQITV